MGGMVGSSETGALKLFTVGPSRRGARARPEKGLGPPLGACEGKWGGG